MESILTMRLCLMSHTDTCRPVTLCTVAQNPRLAYAAIRFSVLCNKPMAVISFYFCSC